jgi:hypothetical protein
MLPYRFMAGIEASIRMAKSESEQASRSPRCPAKYRPSASDGLSASAGESAGAIKARAAAARPAAPII